MITTVTLSPSIDKTIVLRRLDSGGVNRAESSRLDAGGKGVNVSLALSALEIPTRAVGLNFELGERIDRTLAEAGVERNFIKCPGQIRCNTKLYDRESRVTTEINEKNPPVAAKYIQKIIDICKSSSRDSDIIVLSGSLPPAIPDDIYYRIILAAREANPRIRVVLDSSGAPLLSALRASPYLIKPNAEELEESFGVKAATDAETVAISRKIISDYGVKVVLTSMGARGAIIVTKTEAMFALPCAITPHSAQGAGDAMVAGACLALSKNLRTADILRCGTCAASGSVELEGTAFCTRERFESLFLHCTIANIG